MKPEAERAIPGRSTAAASRRPETAGPTPFSTSTKVSASPTEIRIWLLACSPVRSISREASRPRSFRRTGIACCDSWLYAHYGCEPGHANCRDNFLAALGDHDISPKHVPNPVNLWMNTPVVNEAIELATPLSRPGDHVLLRAAMDLYVVFSACPMDVVPINGEACKPMPVHYQVRHS